MVNISKPNAIAPSHTAASAAYDEVTYDSKPFSQTNPLLLQGIGRLFGLTASSPYNARILEIGCATGTNILAIASLYPNSRCVGIDYSQRQIEIGQKEMEQRGITNLELKHMSVMDLTPDFGSFDYIICHGVMSWVPKEVQDKIFEVCKLNLSANGIAYISYNTSPGWKLMDIVRDMILYHTSPYDDPTTKVQQARQALSFIGEAMRESANPMAAVIDREIKRITPLPDYYLLHEYLTGVNTPWYFHEFVTHANSYGLQYLADTELDVMFSANLPAAVAKSLPPSKDFIQTQQYMDFVCNRSFRSTLLCHNTCALTLQVSPEILREGWLLCKFGYPQDFNKHDIKSGQTVQFRLSMSNMAMTSSDPILLAMLQVFMEQGSFVRVADLAGYVRTKLNKIQQPFNEASLKTTLLVNALRYVFTRGLLFYMEKPQCVRAVSQHPMVSSLARYQSLHQDWVTNLLMELFVNVPAFDKILMRYADGTRTLDALSHAMLPHYVSGELVFSENSSIIKDMNVLKRKMPMLVAHALQRFAEISLLVS